MDSHIQRHQNHRPFPVDIVATPLADYIVVAYKDPFILKHPERAGSVEDFSGAHIFKTSKEKGNLEFHISKLVEERPDLQIDGEKVIYQFDMPSGKLGDILCQNSIERIARNYRESYVAKENELRSKGVYTNDPLSIKRSEEIVRENLILVVWEQLIRKSSQNYLPFNHDVPPHGLICDKEGRGLAIVDCSIGANCGFGVGSIFFYEILDTGAEELKDNGVFQKKTLQLRYTLHTKIQALPPYAINPEKVGKLTQRGRVVLFEGWPTFVELDPTQLKMQKSILALENHR